jgi:predicted permease
MPLIPVSLRSLSRSPSHVLVVLLTLALGIGVNVSMYSLVRELLFDPGPYPDPGSLVQVTAVSRQRTIRLFAEAEQREIRGHTAPLKSLTAFSGAQYVLGEQGRAAERVQAITASAELFRTFGIQPVLGRAFTEEETAQGKNQVVLLSHSWWMTRFGGDPAVLGRTLRLDGEVVTIIGVMPRSCEYPRLWGNPVLWRPLNFTHDQLGSRDYLAFQLVGRLGQGASLTQASSAYASLASAQAAQLPQRYTGLQYRVVPLSEALTDENSRHMYWLLLGLSGFVLLIACANLANLQLARVLSRLRELAVRSALGASRLQLILGQVGECLMLSVAGGVLGLLVALLVNRFLESSFLLGGGASFQLGLPLGVLLFAFGVSLSSGLLFGLVPAWLATRMELGTALKQRSAGASLGRGHRRLRSALIVLQVALSLVLLGGAGVVQRGFARLLERRTGWDSAQVLTAALPIPEARFTSEPLRYELYRKIERRIAELPGVEHAAVCSSLPLESYTGERPIFIDGQASGPGIQDPRAHHVMVTSGYFETLGIPFVEGRNFAPDMKPTDPLVIIINESLARKLWPGQSPLGRRIRTDDSGWITWAEVIGVVRDVDTAASFGEPSTRLQIYKPLAHESWAWVNLVVRSCAPAALAESLRRAVSEVDADLALDEVVTVPQFIEGRHGSLLLVGRLLGGFALLGLILSGVGLYSVVSHSVAQRSAEFGIRLALGAQPRRLLELVLAYGLKLVGLGLVLGLFGALGLGRFLASLMPRMPAADPLNLGLISLLMLVVALLSCLLPALRATRVDPLGVLRSE